jgi:hypothetical protein
MIKWIAVWLLCITCSSEVPAQVVKVITCEYPLPGTVTKDTVYYSPLHKLQWSDFTGSIRTESSSAALSFPGFSYDASGIKKGDTVFVTVFLQVYFVKSGSWVRKEAVNSYSLSHEQLHFDIAKLAEEEFKDSLVLKSFSPEYYPIEIHFLFWDYWRKMNEMQEQFDNETHHGINHAAETLWQNKIRILLSGSGQGSRHDE